MFLVFDKYAGISNSHVLNDMAAKIGILICMPTLPRVLQSRGGSVPILLWPPWYLTRDLGLGLHFWSPLVSPRSCSCSSSCFSNPIHTKYLPHSIYLRRLLTLPLCIQTRACIPTTNSFSCKPLPTSSRSLPVPDFQNPPSPALSCPAPASSNYGLFQHPKPLPRPHTPESSGPSPHPPRNAAICCSYATSVGGKDGVWNLQKPLLPGATPKKHS